MIEFFADQMDPNTLRATLRIVLALVLAGIIGLDREIGGHTAGLRTHMVVSVGACLVTLLMIRMTSQFSGESIRIDPVRVIEAVTSGVAFLAAGAIIQARGRVRGLTTGGSLWIAGVSGLACGLGEYLLAVIAVISTMLVLRGVKWIEHKWLKKTNADQDDADQDDRC
ncbi:MgtC/SapB family protein [Consotaella salsifontis]|uniref:Protein MgtC n=1 Tax=Consotaella salsifontis TaxID=1365950 RepID=A0A1T4MC70_9HYPH|nr:MgtC/SapB family protein [Consotaella salsifontis]SJZ64471.1 putative Mg2+ transporter-C (MgtC) family protein [Consotaella salsifontis]